MHISDRQVWDRDPHRELRDLGFERLAPSPWLREVIQCYWGVRAVLSAPRRENLYPDAGWGLSFSFGDPPLSPDAAGPGGTLDGVSARRRELVLLGRVDLFGVRFHPGAGIGLIGAKPSEVRDRVVPLCDLDLRLDRLADQLAETPTTAERAARFEEILTRHLERPTPDLVVHARKLLHAGGLVRVGEVAEQLGVGQRRLERVFRAQVGVPPKTLARLVRIRHARLALKLDHDQPLVEVALDAGYSDQAHFTRDFRSVVGLTPGRYRRRAVERSG